MSKKLLIKNVKKMKNLLPILFACFMFLLSPQLTNAQTNIVQNSGFEQGQAFWVFSPTSTVSYGDGCFGAQRANAELVPNSSNITPEISQNITIPSSGISQLALSIKSDVFSSSGQVIVEFKAGSVLIASVTFGTAGQFGCTERFATLPAANFDSYRNQNVTLNIRTANTSGSPVYHIDRVRVF
ncbi:MAG: hypothetical protein FD167_145 [bacterium]|nr:MAG: hypothetical protein FD167_145 [bacterium]